MNVLLMVMVMLMMLSLMTYAKLETYRSTQILDKFFNHYMEIEERGDINKHAEDQYKNTKMSSGPSKTGGAQTKALPRLSLAKLLDKKFKKEHPHEWEQMINLLKNLTDTLYGKHAFYKEVMEHRPSAIEDLAVELTKRIADLESQNKPKTAADLANVPIKDEELNLLFYKMLLGAPYKEILQQKTPETKATGAEADSDESEETLQGEEKEYSSPQGYYSLLDFITLRPSEKIRVYLAPKELLLSIFHDPDLVDQIIDERKQLYKSAVGADTPEEIKGLTESFKSQYDKFKDPTIDDKYLDWTVNKTNPKEYEKSPNAK